jgi:hypothetical protein
MATFQKYKQGQANTFVGTQATVGTLYGVNTNLHVVTINAGASVGQVIRGNLVTESAVTGGVIEAIVGEVNPLAYYTTGSTATNQANLFLVTDITIKASDLQHRIRQIGAGSPATRLTSTTFTYANTAVGPNAVDISSTQVVGGTSFTVL